MKCCFNFFFCRLFDRSFFTSSKCLSKKQEEVEEEKSGYLKQRNEIHQKDLQNLKKYFDKSRSYTFISFSISGIVYFAYMALKTENDGDIKSNLQILKNEEQMCVKAIAQILKAGTEKETVFYQKRLLDVRKEIDENKKKLEGLELWHSFRLLSAMNGHEARF